MKTCFPLSTAYSKCRGLKPGGVARITTSHKSIAFLYESKPTKIFFSFKFIFFLFPKCSFIPLRLFSILSENTSAIEIISTLSSASIACTIAPDPLPPHPTSDIFNFLFSVTLANASTGSVVARVAVDKTAVFFTKFLLDSLFILVSLYF